MTDRLKKIKMAVVVVVAVVAVASDVTTTLVPSHSTSLCRIFLGSYSTPKNKESTTTNDCNRQNINKERSE